MQIIPETKAGRVGSGLIAIVFLMWVAYAGMTIAATTRKWPPDIEALGQSGDTFGSLNALFTGAALIGVGLTVALQRQELQLARENAARDHRERFLSARINAATAALAAGVKEPPGHTLLNHDYKTRGFSMHEARVRQQIGFLRMEAEMGFSGRWSQAVETESVARYFLVLLYTEASAMRHVFRHYKEDVGESPAKGTPEAKRYDDYLEDMKSVLDQEVSCLSAQPNKACQPIFDLIFKDYQQLIEAIKETRAVGVFRAEDIDAGFCRLIDPLRAYVDQSRAERVAGVEGKT
jgi:hypothetical protein